MRGVSAGRMAAECAGFGGGGKRQSKYHAARFSELERSGLVITQRNMGRVVTQDTQMIESAKHKMAVTQTESFFANMRQLGFSDSEIVSLVNSYTNDANNANHAVVSK